MSNLAIFQSKKATMAVISAVMSFICLKNGLTAEQTALVVSPILAYIPIQGAIDHKTALVDAAEPEEAPQPPKV